MRDLAFMLGYSLVVGAIMALFLIMFALVMTLAFLGFGGAP